jgi:5-methylcytosine-specific restriction endonuclease McrA
MARPYFKTLTGEDFMWFVEDVVEAARRCGSFAADSELLSQIEKHIEQIQKFYDATNDEEYWKQVKGDGQRKLVAMFKKFCRLRVPLSEMRTLYACEVAERILHDRELCHFIAETVMDIGFDGETVKGLRSQWVDRERWPSWVKTILLARDRGKCAACGIDMATELRAPTHIDHMFPIARGGCNDLVNLQLLCSKCNQTKLDRAAEVTSSVPPYSRLQRGTRARNKPRR